MTGAIHIPDPSFREAVAAIDAGDARALQALLHAHPHLLRERADCGEGYFHRPYLLWFVAENPIRNGRLPPNVAQVARTIVQAARREGIDTLREQLDYTLALVCSGRIARECGVQRELVDLLVDAGADPAGAMLPALAHKEVDAAERLLEHGAPLTLTAAVCTGRGDDVARLLPAAGAAERQTALIAAAVYGDAGMLALLVDSGVEVSACGPEGFHAHATALHQAVDSGSLAAVKVLAEAGADLAVRDRVHHGTPLDWAEHLDHPAVTDYLREKMAAA